MTKDEIAVLCCIFLFCVAVTVGVLIGISHNLVRIAKAIEEADE